MIVTTLIFDLVVMLSSKHTFRLSSTAFPVHQFPNPAGDLIQPATGDHDTGDGVDEANEQGEEAGTLLADHEQDGLNVILEENAGDEEWAFGEVTGLGGGGVLVGEDEVLVVAVGELRGRGVGVGVESAVALGVDGWDDGEEVLVLVVVGFGGGDGLIEGVEEGRIVRTEGEFGDHVGEVEDCHWLVWLFLFVESG